MNRKVDLSHKTVIFITIFLLLLWITYLILDVILLFFVAVIFMSAMAPIVDRLMSWRVPKTLAVTIAYIFVIGIIATLLSLVITPLAEQTPTLASTLPHTLEQLLPPGLIDRSLLQKELTNISKNAVSFSLTIFSNFVALISVAVLTFYLLLEKDRAEKLLSQFFVHHEARAKRLIGRIEYKLGAWLRGQIILSVMIGLLVYVVLSILNVPYAIPLAILAGLLEIVPVIGPIIAAIPAILIAYVMSPILALMVALSFFVIQQLENSLIVPQVMKKAVGLNPLIVILAIAVGGRLLGIAGALLAVPITVVIQLIFEEVLHKDIS